MFKEKLYSLMSMEPEVEEMPKFKYEYTEEIVFFKRDFHLFTARLKSPGIWELWAIPTKCWNVDDHHKKPPIYLGKWKHGEIIMCKDYYNLDWGIRDRTEVLYGLIRKEMKKRQTA